VLNLSDSADIDQVCDDAALEIVALRNTRPPRPWRD
jgi:hypothetical protein